MEAFLTSLESQLLSIPLPYRQVCMLATMKLLGYGVDEVLLEVYAARLVELNAANGLRQRGYTRVLEMCIEAYGTALGARTGSPACAVPA